MKTEATLLLEPIQHADIELGDLLYFENTGRGGATIVPFGRISQVVVQLGARRKVLSYGRLLEDGPGERFWKQIGQSK